MLAAPPSRATMKAKDLMTKDVLTVDKDERLETVLDLMRKHRVSKLVVVEKGAVVGVVTDGDVADELGAIKNRGVPASHLHASSAMRRRFPSEQYAGIELEINQRWPSGPRRAWKKLQEAVAETLEEIANGE